MLMLIRDGRKLVNIMHKVPLREVYCGLSTRISKSMTQVSPPCYQRGPRGSEGQWLVQSPVPSDGRGRTGDPVSSLLQALSLVTVCRGEDARKDCVPCRTSPPFTETPRKPVLTSRSAPEPPAVTGPPASPPPRLPHSPRGAVCW